MKKTNGITLIVLVITIIILLILSGIVIATLMGENGLISKTKQAKEKYSISEAKEKLELAIANLRIEQEEKGEELTKENLPQINNDEIDVGNIENFPVEIICNDYKFNVDSNFNVTYIEKANRTVITYTTIPEGYTNKANVKISIKISNSKGIKAITTPDKKDNILSDGRTQIGIDYEVTQNGTYTFKIIDTNNNEVIKDIVIDKIDTVEPKDFTPTIDKNLSDGFTIIANTEDEDKTDTSTKSGIDYYEYHVIDSNGIDTKYDTKEISNLFSGNYKIYVIAYDKAGNSKKSQTIETDLIAVKHTWNLGVENNYFEAYQGTPEYKGKEEGVYLSNKSILSTKENFNLGENYTILIEIKDIKNIGVGFMVAMGYGGSDVGEKVLGILNWQNSNKLYAMSGSGDSCTIAYDNSNLYSSQKWNILAIKYNGSEFSLFVDGKKVGSSGSSTRQHSKLYIGGISNSGTYSAGGNWGYGQGYYRNLAIYETALSDEEVINYKF